MRAVLWTTFIIAVAPAIVLCVYIYKKDTAEKEPIGFLLKLLMWGAIITIPASLLEIFGDKILTLFLSAYNLGKDSTQYKFFENFFVIALVEEGLKWLVLTKTTQRNKNFNSLFDGLVYAVFVSLGFAAFENINYVFSFGWSTALVRAFTAIPSHAFNGVLMGYFYSMWHVLKISSEEESRLQREHRITIKKPAIGGKRYYVLSIIVPIILHGFYDFCCSFETKSSNLVFIAFMIFMYIFCFVRVNKFSKLDATYEQIITNIINKKYPELSNGFNENHYTDFNP